MPNETTHYMVIPYHGNNKLVRQILECYDRVIKDREPFLMAAEQSKVPAVSASALYDLGTKLLEPSVRKQLSAEALGATSPEIEEAKPKVYEAVRFIATEVLQRWYDSLTMSGLDKAEKILQAIKKVEGGEIATTREIVDLVNEFAKPVSNLIKIDDLKPRKGWGRLNEELEFEELVRKGKIHIGQYL